MYSYFALFSPEADGKIFVYFPDINVATCGDDMDEALFMAEDALRTHIENSLEDKEDIPSPSPLKKARQLAEKYCKEIDIPIDENASYQFIRTQVAEKPVRVNVTFAPTILSTIDKSAKAFGVSRSAFLAIAAQNYISKSV